MAILIFGAPTPLPNVDRSRLPRTLRARDELTAQFGHERENTGLPGGSELNCAEATSNIDTYLRRMRAWLETRELEREIWHRQVECC